MSPEPKKKRGALFWILIGLGGFALLFALAIGGIGYFAYSTMQNAGITPELLKSNPKFAAHKMVVMVDQDLEVVSENPETDEIIVRSKSKGANFQHKLDQQSKSVELVPVAPAPEVK
jgi:flagellar basal body-associated protein FliL